MRGVRVTAVAFLAASIVVPGKGAGSATIECGPPPASEPCPEWIARYEGTGQSSESARTIVTSADGTGLFVAGESYAGATQADIAVASYDPATGAERWTLEHREASNDLVTAMTLSPDGETVFVTGPSMSGTNDYLTIAVRVLSGETIWTARLDGGGPEDYPHAIAPSADGGRVYVTGYIDAGQAAGARNFATVAYDAKSGAQLWLATTDGAAHAGDVARAIVVGTYADQDGTTRERVFLTGRSNGTDQNDAQNDFATVALDGATGTFLWEARYDGPARGRDYPMGLALSPDRDTVYVTGESDRVGTGFDYATVAYDAATGQERWSSRFDRSDEEAHTITPSRSPSGDVAVSPSGDRIFVTGYGFEDGNYYARKAVTFALDAASGSQIWSAVRTGPLGEAGNDVLVSPDGKTVHVGGQAGGAFGGVVSIWDPVLGPASSDVSGFLAIAYDAASGTELWVAHHGMVASDARHVATALSRDGSQLFLTGGEFGDLTTVAYGGTPTSD